MKKLRNMFLCTRARTLTVLFVICGAITLQSCNGDDEEPASTRDVSAPKISFKSPADYGPGRNLVKNKVLIDLIVVDDKRVAKVEIFIDHKLFTTLTSAPYSITWDSRTVEDGLHNIEAVATDVANNSGSNVFSVEVKNTLLKVFAQDNLLRNENGYKQRGFIFLSDAQGKLITSAEYKNGKKIELKSPDFADDTFYVTEVEQITEQQGGNTEDRIKVLTYPLIRRGDTWFASNIEDTSPLVRNTSRLLTDKTSYKFDGEKLTCKVDGNFDFAVIGYYVRNSFRAFVLTSGSGSIPELEFPKELKSLLPSRAVAEYRHTIYDVDNVIKDVNDIRKYAGLPGGFSEYLGNRVQNSITYVSTTNSGGSVSIKHVPQNP